VRRETRESLNGVREIERRLPDGGLDRSFGGDGRVRVGLGAGIALRSDGNLVVATNRCRGERASATLLDPRGEQVASFGVDGCAPPLAFGPSFAVLDPAGRILLAGSREYCPPCGKSIPRLSETVVGRLLPDGHPDPSFGKNGAVGTHADLGLQPTGSFGEESLEPIGILATVDGGTAVAAGKLLLRLDPAGALDPGFDKDGVAEVKGSTAGLISEPDGSIVVASTLTEATYIGKGEVFASRFRADGTPDPGFGDGGAARLPLPADATASAIVSAPGGRLLVAGELSPGEDCRGRCTPSPFLARLLADGQIDTTYDGDGIAILPLPPNEGLSALGISALVVAADGKALVVGGEYAADAFAFRRDPYGSPDAGFGGGGTLIERHYLPPALEPSGFAPAPGGGFTVAAEGTAGTHEYGGFLLGFRRNGQQERYPGGLRVVTTAARGEVEAIGGGRMVSLWGNDRLLTAVDRRGAVVDDFGEAGRVKLPSSFEPRGLAGGPKGSFTVVGTVGEQRAMAVYRFDRNGRPLPGFGRNGLATVDFGRVHALAFAAQVEADGSVVLTGWVNGRTGVARLRSNGRLDRRFGDGGRLRGLVGKGTYGSWIAPLRGGFAIAATNEDSPDSLAGIVRLDRRGQLVRGFGRRGAVRPHTDGPPLGLFTGRGRIVVVTDTENDPRSDGGVELRAYRPNGSVDKGFGRGGLARGGFNQVKYFHPVAALQQRDGKICVAGAAWNGEYGQVELLRFR
jgi:uncharacterized delta-60 repeat protein